MVIIVFVRVQNLYRTDTVHLFLGKNISDSEGKAYTVVAQRKQYACSEKALPNQTHVLLDTIKDGSRSGMFDGLSLPLFSRTP